jgi:hypothetical protein
MPRKKKRIAPVNRHTTPWGMRQRLRIDSSMVIDRLEGHVRGDVDLTQTQIQAARILLDRTMPALKVIEVSTRQADSRDPHSYSAQDLLEIIDGEAQRVEPLQLTDKSLDALETLSPLTVGLPGRKTADLERNARQALGAERGGWTPNRKQRS